MMRHRARVSRDDDHRWAGVCDCGEVWHSSRWADAFGLAFYHVRARRRGAALGVGFTSEGQTRT